MQAAVVANVGKSFINATKNFSIPEMCSKHASFHVSCVFFNDLSLVTQDLLSIHYSKTIQSVTGKIRTAQN